MNIKEVPAAIGVMAMIMAISSVFDGLILSVLWGWFFVPTLRLPNLTIPQAIGITVVVKFLTRHGAISKPKEEKDYGKMIRDGLYAIAKPLIILGIGYVVHLFL